MKWLLVWMALVGSATAQIQLNELVPVEFGQSLADVAQKLEEKPFPTERGRPGVDQMIATTTAQLFFDTDKLWRVILRDGHLMPKPLTPFAEPWKNFDPIDGHSLKWPVTRAQFDPYLAAWRERATAAGKKEGSDYWIAVNEGANAPATVTLTLAPRRRLHGTGELTGDMWMFEFAGAVDTRFNPDAKIGDLRQIVVTCDRFSTQRRAPEGQVVQRAPRVNGQPLAAPGVRGAKVIFDDGKTVEMGQPIEDAEKVFGPSRESSLSQMLKSSGVEREIVTPTAKLEFDRGRLKSVDFTEAHAFVHPVRVFDEPWKNPDPIGDQAITRGMTRQQFETYVTAWKKRAADAGKKEQVDYHISSSGDELSQHVSVSLAPDRLTSNGRGIWADTWSVWFESAKNGGTLQSVHVLVDAYNSLARPAPGQPDPTHTGARLDDGTEVYFGQSLAEVQALTGGQPSLVGKGLGSRAGGAHYIHFRTFSLYFDTERLEHISYHRTIEPPAPFPQLWKNFTPIGEHSVRIGMSKEAFMQYFEAWEKRAVDGRLERGRDYTVREEKAERSEALIVRMPVGFSKFTGQRWPDMWVVNFGASAGSTKVRGIDAYRGEFNSRPSSPATQRKREVNEMTKTLPHVEPPKLELVLPGKIDE